MAVGRIKGITIELGGDSTKLEACLKNVNQEIRTTESKLKDVNKLLKMDPGNTNRKNCGRADHFTRVTDGHIDLAAIGKSLLSFNPSFQDYTYSCG